MPHSDPPPVRRPGRFRRWVVRPAVWGTALVIVVLTVALWLAERGPVQRWATEQLVQRLSERLGRPVGIGSLRLALLPLSLQAKDVWIAGEHFSDPPLLVARSLLIEAEPWRLPQSVLELSHVRVEGVRLRLERDEDGLRLPRWQSAGDGKLELRVGLVEVVDARVELAEQTVPLTLRARAVHGQVQQTGSGEFAGRVAAQEVEVALPGERQLTAAVAGKLRIGVRALAIEAVRVTAPLFDLRVDGTIALSPTIVDLTVTGGVEGQLATTFGAAPGAAEGRLQVTGEVGWRAGSWGVRADVAAPRLAVYGRPLEALRGRLALDRHSVQFDLERAAYADGSLGGTVRASGVERWTCEVDLVVDRLDLPTLMRHEGLTPPELAARVSGAFDYRFDLDASRQGSGWAELTVDGAVARGRLPLSGEVPLNIQGGEIGVAGARLAGGGQQLGVEGAYGLEREAGRFELALSSSDLAPLFGAVPGVDPAGLWVPSSGRGEVTGMLEIERGEVRSELDLVLVEVVAPGLRADQLTGTVVLDGDGLERLRLELSRPKAALLVEGEIPFSPSAEQPLDLTVEVAGWPVEEARPWLPFELPLVGSLGGSIGIRQWPQGIEGTLEASLSAAEVAGFPLMRLSSSLSFDDQRVAIERLTFTDEAGSIEVWGEVGTTDGSLALELAASALELDRAPLASLVGGRLTGAVSLDGQVSGTLERPRLEAELRGERLEVGGRALGSAGRAQLALGWDAGRVSAEGSVLGLASLRGGGRLEGSDCDLSFDLWGLDLSVLAAVVAASPPATLAGEAAGRLAISASAGEPLRFAVELDELGLEVGGRRLRALEPVAFSVAGNQLQVSSLYLGGEGGDELFVAGSVGLDAPHGLDLRLQSSLSNRWLAELLPDVEVAGTTDLLATIRGSVDRPLVNGQGEVRDGRLLVAGFPHSLEELSAVLLFSPGEVVLDTASAELGGGRLRAEGRMRLPTPKQDTSFRLQLDGQRISLRYPEGWSLRGDTTLVLSRDPDGQRLAGVLNLDRAFYQRDLEISVAQLLARFLRRQRLEAGDAAQALASTQLDLSIEVQPGGLRVRNDVADLEGEADLVVRGTLVRPVVFGTVEAEPGGSLVYSETRYEVERGLLTFASSQKIDPLVDLSARARVAEYDLRMTLSGTLEKLNASFASDPPLPDLEVLSLLTGGEKLRSGVAGGISSPSRPLASAAEGLLFGQASALISRRVGTLFGLDTFRLEPLTSGGESVSSARVRVGKRISKVLHVGLSYDPTSSEEQRIEVEWQAAEGITVLLTQNGNDSYSVDLRWERRF